MQFTYVLAKEDVQSFCLLAYGGRRRLAYWAVNWAALFGTGAFLLLALLRGHLMAAALTGAAIASAAVPLLYRRAMRDIEQRVKDLRAPGVFDRHVVHIDADGIRTATSLCTSEYAWGFIQHCVSWPAMTGIWLNSGVALVLPSRAIPDRAALITLLRAHCSSVQAIGCPKCGYDTSRALAERCPECGWGSPRSA